MLAEMQLIRPQSPKEERNKRLARYLVLPISAALSLAGEAYAQAPCNGTQEAFMYFGHDSLGYDAPSGTQGPSLPCQAMKAVTEGALTQFAYQGVRASDIAPYSRNAPNHEDVIEIELEARETIFESNAEEGTGLSDRKNYLYYYASLCDPALPNANTLTLNRKFQIPLCTCADVGSIKLLVSSGGLDPDWEAPELVNNVLKDPVCTVNPAHLISQGTDNRVGGWVIQDECESGSAFQYPQPLPTPGTDVGYTLQLATALSAVTGVNYSQEYGPTKFKEYVNQNYPFAASEVVSEGSWLEFAVVLVDENAAALSNAPPHNPIYEIHGVAVRPLYKMGVKFDFLRFASQWGAAPLGCPNVPIDYAHYAETEDYVLQVQKVDGQGLPIFDAQGKKVWEDITPNAQDEYVVFIDTNQLIRDMRFMALDLDITQEEQDESHEIAHLRIVDAFFVDLPSPPPQFIPDITIGWSSAFRFVIQEDELCQSF